MKVRANDVELNAVIDGREGAPWVTFVSGIANDHTLWDGSVRSLTAHGRLLRLDTRGHGLSGTTAAPYSLPLLAADIVAVWDSLGIERSCIVGLGLGGVVAAEVAWRHPDRVTALVPVSCRAKLTPEYQAIWPPLIEAATRGGVQAIAEPTLARWFSEHFRREHPKTIAAVREALLRTTLEGYLGCIGALLTLDWEQRLSTFRMPVLYVSGELDRVGAPSEVMQAMCDATPDAWHVVLAEATHISVVCNPDAFSGALTALLRKLAT